MFSHSYDHLSSDSDYHFYSTIVDKLTFYLVKLSFHLSNVDVVNVENILFDLKRYLYSVSDRLVSNKQFRIIKLHTMTKQQFFKKMCKLIEKSWQLGVPSMRPILDDDTYALSADEEGQIGGFIDCIDATFSISQDGHAWIELIRQVTNQMSKVIIELIAKCDFYKLLVVMSSAQQQALIMPVNGEDAEFVAAALRIFIQQQKMDAIEFLLSAYRLQLGKRIGYLYYLAKQELEDAQFEHFANLCNQYELVSDEQKWYELTCYGDLSFLDQPDLTLPMIVGVYHYLNTRTTQSAISSYLDACLVRNQKCEIAPCLLKYIDSYKLSGHPLKLFDFSLMKYRKIYLLQNRLSDEENKISYHMASAFFRELPVLNQLFLNFNINSTSWFKQTRVLPTEIIVLIAAFVLELSPSETAKIYTRYNRDNFTSYHSLFPQRSARLAQDNAEIQPRLCCHIL